MSSNTQQGTQQGTQGTAADVVVAPVVPFSTEQVTAEQAVSAMLASKSAETKRDEVIAQVVKLDADAFILSALTTAAYLFGTDVSSAPRLTKSGQLAMIKGNTAGKLATLAKEAETGYTTPASVMAHGRTGLLLMRVAGEFRANTSARDIQSTFGAQASAKETADGSRPMVGPSDVQLVEVIGQASDRADALKRLEAIVKANRDALKPSDDGAGAGGAGGDVDGQTIGDVDGPGETLSESIGRALELIRQAAKRSAELSAADVTMLLTIGNEAADLALLVESDDVTDVCAGHESLDGAHMGESVFCDGSCISDAA